ncbi:MAG: hypothetical protein M0007_14815, partial [Actinomycetota bacterium]|nr:hypothetical protein [Actinomycetota bacterium]
MTDGSGDGATGSPPGAPGAGGAPVRVRRLRRFFIYLAAAGPGLIAANASRFGASVKVVCAAAPDCFPRLPRPDLAII